MNIQEILAKMTALENEVNALKSSNTALKAKVAAIDHRIDNLVVCDAPPINKPKPTPSVSELIQKFEPQETQEPIDWIVKGTEAVNATTSISSGYKCSVITTWKKAMEAQASNKNLKEVWSHLLTWCNGIEHNDHRKTKMGELKTAFKYMGMEYDSDFNIEHEKLTNKLKHEQEYKQLTPEELKKYKCTNGTYLTIQKLRAFYTKLPDTVSDFHRMQLAFVIFHAQRPQH
jgi:regulator of replication initiation timing